MGYNLTRASVERWQPILEQLLEIREPTRIETNDPVALAYRLREAIAAAKALTFKPYDQLALTFALEPGCVIAKPRLEATTLVAQIITKEHRVPDNLRFVSQEAKTTFEVAGIVQGASGTLVELSFPNFKGDLEAVTKLAEAKGWNVTSAEPVLTLERQQESDA